MHTINIEEIDALGWQLLVSLKHGGPATTAGEAKLTAAKLLRMPTPPIERLGGHCVRISEAGNALVLAGLGDEDRLRLAVQPGMGPAELQECSEHPGEYEVYGWSWDDDEPDQLAALQNGECEFVAACPKCEGRTFTIVASVEVADRLPDSED